MIINKNSYLFHIKNKYHKNNFNKNINFLNKNSFKYNQKSFKKLYEIEHLNKNNIQKNYIKKNNKQIKKILKNLDKYEISFKVAIQIRNKLISAYHEIMNIQI
ncbi:MAG: flagellar hook-basal body complex protein FliE [Buchnera aphidicola (Periphyllus lyropictus)]|uniref:flagellar hook-basal body complex protein FliE n=1 Tax=Buchnera aphidicola TaxID=9 RepID=UPI001EB5AC58|nr:flagellar hook-basal body complex protein FliE [Buchnera aphidicola]NIH16754.1 flagellar hook-basal body complex protein FliE [Buchnera aphidicola (Periphyllus lyropictus)]USS94655.1 flagellar hook-basal body complex protein FliE [Buchnera aphidicola (Periphyllus lyropictus)]